MSTMFVADNLEFEDVPSRPHACCDNKLSRVDILSCPGSYVISGIRYIRTDYF